MALNNALLGLWTNTAVRTSGKEYSAAGQNPSKLGPIAWRMRLSDSQTLFLKDLVRSVLCLAWFSIWRLPLALRLSGTKVSWL